MPSNLDLEIWKGDFLPFTVILKDDLGTPIDLSGSTPRSQIRSLDDAEVYEFAITMNPTAGSVTLTLPSAVSNAIQPGDYVWDFQITNSEGNTRTYLAGDVTVFGEVTRVP